MKGTSLMEELDQLENRAQARRDKQRKINYRLDSIHTALLVCAILILVSLVGIWTKLSALQTLMTITQL